MFQKVRLSALAVAVMLAVCCTGTAFAEASWAGQLHADPALDFSGKNVYIYNSGFAADYWDRYSAAGDDHTEEEKNLYAFREQLQTDCNVRIHEAARGDWSSSLSEMIGFAYQGGEEDKLALFVFSTDQIAGILSAGAASPVSCDFSGEYWNRNIISLMTTGGKTYGAGIGTSQPGQCLYFNKRVLTDAGIDWQNLYDLQAAGEWTWDTFEQVLKQIRDSGTADTAPLGGSSADLYQIAVLSCGGSFIGAGEDGTPFPAADSDRTKNALAWAKKLWNTYSAAKPEGASWNWSSEVWLEGKIAFYVGRIYQGFSVSGFEGLQDEWGCLAFPTQEASGLYITEAAGKVALVPACYDEETAGKLMQLYGLWTAPETPVYDTDGLFSLFPSVSDSRALNETYAMLSAPDHQIIPKTCLLGSANSVLGTLLWSLADTDPEALISPCSSAWTDMCSQLEKNIDDRSFRVIFPESINSWTEPYVLIRADDQASSYKLLIESGNETVCEDTNAAPGRNAVPVSAFAKGGDFVLTCRALDSTGAEIGAATQIYTGVMPMQ